MFGIPRLHDDDAVRAVRAAAELRGVLGAVAARIGIATGEVFVDDSEADGVFVTGEPVRLAARVQAAAALNAVGSLYALRARFGDARTAVGQSIELYAEAGMAAHGAGTTYTLAEIELAAGDPAAAEAAVRPGYEAFTAMGEKSFRAGGAVYLGRAVYAQGRYDEAQEFTNVVKDCGEPQEEIEWRALQAKLLARRDASADALALGHEAVALARRGDSLIHIPRTLTDLAEVLSLLGLERDAAEALEEALSLHERKGNLAGAEQAQALLAGLSARPA